MPKVPGTPQDQPQALPQVDPKFLAMAVAQMHSEGRWEGLPASQNIEDRRNEHTAAQNDTSIEFAQALAAKSNPRHSMKAEPK